MAVAILEINDPRNPYLDILFEFLSQFHQLDGRNFSILEPKLGIDETSHLIGH